MSGKKGKQSKPEVAAPLEGFATLDLTAEWLLAPFTLSSPVGGPHWAFVSRLPEGGEISGSIYANSLDEAKSILQEAYPGCAFGEDPPPPPEMTPDPEPESKTVDPVIDPERPDDLGGVTGDPADV